jgi:cytoskeletal protein RodZ
MKNKGITYIALGIGAGIVAYYLFCRKKAKEQLQEVVEQQQQQEPQKETRKGAIGGGGGGGFAPASPVTSRPLYATPVATTPLSVNVTTTSTPTPTPTTTITAIKPTPPTITDTPTATITPIRTESIAPVLFVDENSTRPILTTKPTPPTTTTTTTPVVSKEAVPYSLQKTPLMIEEKPILNTAVRQPIVRETMALAPQILQLEASKQLAFDGSKTMAFEVGGCLNDL